MIEQIFFNIKLIAPIFLLVVLGIFLRYIKLLDDDFVRKTSKFVFNVSLPALIINKLAAAHLGEIFDFSIIYFAVVITLIQAVLSWLTASKFTAASADRGVFAQGAFRSNFAIVGLAVLGNVAGDAAVGKASVVLAFIMPLYNILAVVVLLLPHREKLNFDFKKMGLEIILNPLIISVFIALPFSAKVISMPSVITELLKYLGVIALPLALIDIGATVNFKYILTASGKAFLSAFLKILIFPLVFTSLAVYLGFTGIDAAVLFMVFGCPTAIASFPMAEAMGGNIKLAGNIVILSTLFSVITMSVGFGILTYLGILQPF